MQSMADELLEKTRMYWKVSQAFYGTGKEMSTGTALYKCNDILDQTTFTRALFNRTLKLRTEIIVGEVVPFKTPAKLLDLKQARA